MAFRFGPPPIRVIQIGTQRWTQRNLVVRTYRNGDSISTSNYYDYDGNAASQSLYGFLYDWTAVTDARGLAPKGFHIPSQGEWDILTGSAGNGSALKEAGITNWASPNTGGTNSVGFTALPAGIFSGTYLYQTTRAYFWTSTNYNTTNAISYAIQNNSVAQYTTQLKTIGMSVRCLVD